MPNNGIGFTRISQNNKQTILLMLIYCLSFMLLSFFVCATQKKDMCYSELWDTSKKSCENAAKNIIVSFHVCFHGSVLVLSNVNDYLGHNAIKWVMNFSMKKFIECLKI